MLFTEISKINAMEILDSRGNPTVSCKITLSCGAVGSASVPSGASTGKHEACELRDGGVRYGGRGVLEVCKKLETELSETLCGNDASNQKLIDGILLRADGTPKKSIFGANALLAVSLACARACANAYSLPLYKYLGGIYGSRMPKPMMNVINGGAHADNGLDIQEFMIVPVDAKSLHDGIMICAEIYSHLRALLKKDGYSTGVGDEGGFAPNLSSDEQALEYLCKAIESAGYNTDCVKLAIDAAAGEWESGVSYKTRKTGQTFSAEELICKFQKLCQSYPIISIEDPAGQDDITAWRNITREMGESTMLVGDDLFVTDAHRISTLSSNKCANAVLIKPNQCGTLSETISAMHMAKKAGYKTIVSHRSGDTCDSFISDLAVASCADFIKAGAPARGERTAKYNRLLEIENDICLL